MLPRYISVRTAELRSEAGSDRLLNAEVAPRVAPLLEIAPISSQGRVRIVENARMLTRDAFDGAGRFDAIVISGLPAFGEQVGFLKSQLHVLADDGIVCIRVCNRLGWNRLRRREAGPPASGLRTYASYVQLFAAAGCTIRSVHISPDGSDESGELVPLQHTAIRHYARLHEQRFPAVTATEWFWRTFGDTFVFILEAREGHA